MAYTRQPNIVLAGTALNQNPPASTLTPAGIVPVTLDANVATTTSLGVIQVGDGLAVSPAGVLSATSSSAPIINVKLTSVSYTAVASDCYVGATSNGITITLPAGVLGKVYIVKNQANSGNITVTGTGGQRLDGSLSKTLGEGGMLMTVFEGTKWSLI